MLAVPGVVSRLKSVPSLLAAAQRGDAVECRCGGCYRKPPGLARVAAFLPEQDSAPPAGISVVTVNTESDGEAKTRGVLTSATDIVIQIDAPSGPDGAA